MTEYPFHFQAVQFRECCRNFDIDVGRVVLDGCSEFILYENEVISCAVCGCQQNFHRQEEVLATSKIYSEILDPLQPPLSLPPVMETAPAASEAGGATPKRKKTKFTNEQWDRMKEFAKDCGWRTARRDKAIIDMFCQGIRIDPKAYKNWVKHNKGGQGKKRMMD